jgi:hypothetical protein
MRLAWQLRFGASMWAGYRLNLSNVAENILDDRGITDPFSGGDCDMRPKHETLLGIGSCSATEVLGSEPTILTLG